MIFGCQQNLLKDTPKIKGSAKNLEIKNFFISDYENQFKFSNVKTFKRQFVQKEIYSKQSG